MKTKIINYSKISAVILSIVLIAFCAVCGCANQAQKPQEIGVTWTTNSNSKNVILSVEKAGDKATVMPEVKFNDFKYDEEKIAPEYLDEYGMLTFENAEKIKQRPYEKTNVADVVKNYKAVIFPGGADICPSLYKDPQPWYDYSDKPEFDAARDVSDYIIMAYCLDNDIPVLGICRGMQMYNVVSGGTMIQDLPTYFKEQGVAYNNEHTTSGQLDGKKVLGNHPVNIEDTSSLLYQAYQEDTILLPVSSHHQAALTADPEHSKVVATASVNGVKTIEALERADSKAFGLFVQFHPEHSLAKWDENAPEKDHYMNFDESIKIFRFFIEHI